MALVTNLDYGAFLRKYVQRLLRENLRGPDIQNLVESVQRPECTVKLVRQILMMVRLEAAG